MAWDANAKLLAIKTIGTVESNMRYDAVNYNDPITVGIMQWYGTRAANILNEMRATPAWTGVAPTIDNDLATHPEGSSSFWTNRYLTRVEGESLQPVMRTDDGVQTQNAKTLSDFEAYKGVAENRGIDVEANTDAFIYWAMLYHQSPRYANQVHVSAGLTFTLERLHAIALNHSWYSRFKNRLNTARSIILSGDTSGVPEWGVPETPTDPGGDPGTSDPGVDDGPTTERELGLLKSVSLVGNAVHVRMGDRTVVCQPTPTGTLWLPQHTSDPTQGPEIPPPVTPPGDLPPGDPDTAQAVANWMNSRIGQFNYSNTGAQRLNPDVSGYGDCSSTIWRAYRDVAGIEVGTWTVGQMGHGTVVWSNLPGSGNAKGSLPPQSLLRAADMILMSRDNNYQRVRHVELYRGDGTMIGHGGPKWADKGPVVKNWSYLNSWNWIIVRRHL